MENEVSVDLKKLFSIMWLRKKVVVGIIVSCMVVAVATLWAMPRQYESTSLVKIRNVAIGTEDSAEKLIARGIKSEDGSRIDFSPASYVELMKSRAVQSQAEKKADIRISGYRIKNIRETNLISVTGIGRTPEAAQLTAQAIVDSFQEIQEKKNQETQSQIIRILDERIEQTRTAADAASQQGLEGEARIKQTLYMRLMQQREQHIIQRDMPCMDIQIIDPADLPDKDAVLERKKKLTVLEGFVVGGMLALGYGLFCYKREGNK